MSRYPAELDNDNDLPPVIDNITEIGAEAINSLRESVFALERAIGTDPQGSQLSLSERLSRTLNNDGTWKAAQLAASGLVSLPITNDQVGGSAAIEESKLDLDVSTTSLQNQITSNDVDITELQDSLAEDINNLAQHTVGNYGRHDGYQIDISGLTSQPSITTVEQALNFIYDTFLLHRNSTDSIQHFASAISYTPDPDGPITATNVQDAITQRDADITEAFRVHRDSAHSNGISADGYVYLGGQAAVNDASLRLTRYISSVGSNLMKVGLINSAVIAGDVFEPANLSGTSDAITVTAKSGTNSRSITVTGLNSGSADYPSAASPRFKLKGIVNRLNTEFGNASNNFPVTAFESNGRLVLQHNVARSDCTVTVSAPANSALGALGLTAMTDVEVGRVNNYVAVINGREYEEINTVDSGTLVHGGGSTISFGSTITSPTKYKLFHVFNHPTAAANGTYKIISVGASSVNLAASVTAGTFDYIIYEDVFDLPSATNAPTFDFFADENLNLIAEKRVEAAPGPTGIKIVAASSGLTGTTASLQLSTGALQLTVDAVAGTQVTFDNQFVGYVDVPAPDGVEFVTVFLFNAAASNGTSTLTLFDSAAQDNRLLLGTGHFDLGSTIENPLDVRNVGLVGESAIGKEFREGFLERDIANLHISGCIQGLNVETTVFPASSIIVAGGSAYVNGKFIDKGRVTIEAGNRISAASTYNLLLSAEGAYEIFDNSTPGYGIEDIIARDDYVVIAQLAGSGGSVTGSTDARVFVNDLELKLQLTVDERELGAGTFRTLEAAQLYASNAPNDTKPEISIFSDTTITNALTINSNTTIRAIQDFTSTGAAITVTDNSTLEILGNFTSDSTVTVSNNSTLILSGTSNAISAATSISLGTNCKLIIDGYTEAQQITVTGNGCRILSRNTTVPTLAFTANSTGIDVGSGVDDLTISTLDLVMSKTGQNAILSMQAATNIKIFRTSFSLDAPTITTTQATQTDRAGVELFDGAVSDLIIQNCQFSNIAAGIIMSTTASLSRAKISSCTFESVGTGISIDAAEDVLISSNTIFGIHQYGITFTGLTTGTENIIVIGNSIRTNFAGGSSSPGAIQAQGNARPNNSIFSKNIIEDLTTTEVIDLGGNNIIFSENIIRDNTVSSTVVNFASAANTAGVISSNVIVGNTGKILSALSYSIVGNSFETTSVTGAGLTIDATSLKTRVVGNQINLPTDSPIEVIIEGSEVILTDNNIVCDKINFTFTDPGTVLIEGNEMTFSNAAIGSTNGIDFSGYIEPSELIISNNSLTGSLGSTIFISPNAGGQQLLCTITGNVITGGTQSGIELDTNNTVDGALIISNNAVEASGNFGILTASWGTLITGNSVSGSVSTADISAASGTQQVYIAGNASHSTGAGSGIMGSQDATPTAVYVGQNQNVEQALGYDSLTGWTETPSQWKDVNAKITSADANIKYLYVPLNNLPVGGVINTIDLHCYPNGVSAVNFDIFRRSNTSLVSASIVGGGTTNVGVAAREVIIATPSSTANAQILADYSYYARIQSTAIDQEFAQIIVNVQY